MKEAIESILTGRWIQDRVERNPSYELAAAFSDKYQPMEGKDYKWVLDYAIKEYELMSFNSDSLEKKADSLIGYLAAASGLISISLAYGIGDHKTQVLVAAIPALVLLLIGIMLALVARIPQKHPSPPPSKDALEYMLKDDLAAGRFAAYVWTCTQSLDLVNSEKARVVRWAYISFGFGVIWLVAYSIYAALTLH
jgi:hypothetical protein